MKNKPLPIIFAGLLLTLILVVACTDTSEPPQSPAPTQTQTVPLTPGSSGTPGPSVTTKIPVETITSGNPSCPSGQTLCDGSCVDTKSNSQHCGTCGNVCNESVPCSEGTCLSWTGSWWLEDDQRTYDLTQTGTSVSGFDSTYHHSTISGSTSGNPPRLTGTWIAAGKYSFPCTFDMAPDGKSFYGGLLGKNSLTYTREQE
ncbi:MAG: Stigma-specific protein, Stig1 [Methanoregula sp.]